MVFSRLIKWIKLPVFLLCLAPLAELAWKGFQVWKGFHGALTANPIEYIRNSTGFWTLVFLCVTLSVTPLRRLLRRNELVRFRRMFGLFAFFYGSLHFITYIWLEQFFDFRAMVEDVYMRPFITLGFIAFVLMIPLAITSTSGMVRRLGGRRWQMLHRLIYICAYAGVLHYYMKVKSDVTVPQRFAAVITVLLGYRVVAYVDRQASNRPSSRSRPPDSHEAP
jgi:sulfoxide reductase heme-binding subunit YedZ